MSRIDHDERRENLEFLADCGETMENAAKRLGMTLDALDAWLLRFDKPLRARLVANGPERDGSLRQGRIRRTA